VLRMAQDPLNICGGGEKREKTQGRIARGERRAHKRFAGGEKEIQEKKLFFHKTEAKARV